MSSRLRSKFAVNLTIGFFATSNLCRNSGAATALARYGRPSPDRQLLLSLSDCSGHTTAGQGTTRTSIQCLLDLSNLANYTGIKP